MDREAEFSAPTAMLTTIVMETLLVEPPGAISLVYPLIFMKIPNMLLPLHHLSLTLIIITNELARARVQSPNGAIFPHV